MNQDKNKKQPTNTGTPSRQEPTQFDREGRPITKKDVDSERHPEEQIPNHKDHVKSDKKYFSEKIVPS